jgi:hypothetical protein
VPSPDPLIFDARAKPVKSLKNKKKLLNPVDQLAEPSTKPTSSFQIGKQNGCSMMINKYSIG